MNRMQTFEEYTNMNEDFNFLLKSNDAFAKKITKVLYQEADKIGMSGTTLCELLKMIIEDGKKQKNLDFLKKYYTSV